MPEEIETSWKEAKNNTAELAQAYERHGTKLLKIASRDADPDTMAALLEVAKASDPRAELTVLEQSALTGNVHLFNWMLQQRMKPTPKDLHNYWIRLYAVSGGVDIWRALLAYNHEVINWEIGEHGDALGQAVMKRDTALVRFLLDEGIDVKESNFVGMPVLETARAVNAGAEIIDMLEAYGTPE